MKSGLAARAETGVWSSDIQQRLEHPPSLSAQGAVKSMDVGTKPNPDNGDIWGKAIGDLSSALRVRSLYVKYGVQH